MPLGRGQVASAQARIAQIFLLVRRNPHFCKTFFRFVTTTATAAATASAAASAIACAASAGGSIRTVDVAAASASVGIFDRRAETAARAAAGARRIGRSC